jgi:myo-inositol 2-dehydrogenase/D-chiro-inositol 1-dehydrogenase
MPVREPIGVRDPRDRPGVAVIGLGRIGSTHAANAAGAASSVRLVHVMDADAARAEGLGSRFDVPWSTDWRRAIEDPDVDAVVVASPTPTHAEVVAAAAQAGSHVLCEKPLAATSACARHTASLARDSGIVLCVGFQARLDPDLSGLRAAVVDGRIGSVQLVRATLRDERPPPRSYLASAGGLLVDGGVHLLDLARWIGGEIVEITAVARGSSVELTDADHTCIVAEFESGALAVLENSRSSGYGFECQVQAIGTDGSLRISDHSVTRVEWLSAGNVCRDHTRGFLERWRDAYRVELDAFGRAIAGETTPLASGEDAARVSSLADAAVESARRGASIACAPGST